MQKVPFLFLPEKKTVHLFRFLLGLSSFFSRFLPGLKYDLEEMDSSLKVEEYTLLVFLHTLLYSVLFTALFGSLLFSQQREMLVLVQYSALIFLVFFVLFLFVFFRYPHIIGGKKAEEVDKSLIFALKDISLQVSSGVSLYNAFVHVSQEEYGLVSKEFTLLVQDMHRGLPLEKALEQMSKRTRSEYLRRVVWQLINTIKAGASVRGALNTIIEDLSRVQKAKIKDYAQELNLWSLLYMMFAVAIPTLGATMLVILSGFAGFEITPVSFVSFLVITLFIQIVLIGFIKSRRPFVQF